MAVNCNALVVKNSHVIYYYVLYRCVYLVAIFLPFSQVSEAKVTSQQIDIAREFYRPAAARASLLYFILNDLNTINPIYQFSLKVVFLLLQSNKVYL